VCVNSRPIDTREKLSYGTTSLCSVLQKECVSYMLADGWTDQLLHCLCLSVIIFTKIKYSLDDQMMRIGGEMR
jgi:hypothetical protein